MDSYDHKSVENNEELKKEKYEDEGLENNNGENQSDHRDNVDPENKNDFRNMNFMQIVRRVVLITICGVVVFASFYKTINVLGWCFESKKTIETTTEAYRFVHEMTNNVIHAKDGIKWGCIDINQKNIDKTKEYFSDVDSVIVEELKRWENGDFDNSVYFHNYVWEKLNGNIGEAFAIDYIGVDRAVFNLGY